MSIPNTVLTNAAGTPDASNQTWIESGNDGGGFPFYDHSNHDQAFVTLRWNPHILAWTLERSSASAASTNQSVAEVFYYSNAGQTLASGPVGTYAVGGEGTAPAPTVTDAAPPSGGTPPTSPSGRILRPQSQMW